MSVDLEDVWNAAPPAERAQYLRSSWLASDRDKRLDVLRHDAESWLKLSWAAADAKVRTEFVSEVAAEIMVALSSVEVGNGAAGHWNDLMWRINSAGNKHPELSELVEMLRAVLGMPPRFTRGVSPPRRG
jgi:hypothetical protein